MLKEKIPIVVLNGFKLKNNLTNGKYVLYYVLRSTKLYMEKEKIMKDLLYKKFADVPTRPGRGGTYSYIKWQDVADRMNQIFGVQWSSEIVYQDVIGSNVVTRVRVSVLDAGTGDLFHQEGFGGAPIDDRQEAGTPFKAAYSKALKDACRKWGVGLYIEEDGDVEPEVITPKVPAKMPFVPVSPKQEAPVPPVAQKQEVKIPTTSVPPVPPTSASKQPVSNTIPIQQVDPVVKVPNIPPTPMMPSVPKGVDMVSSGGLGIGGGQTTISDVQMAALQSIISIQGVEYDQLVKDAFDSKGTPLSNGIPAMETLSYKDAVTVVKYGNDKFRKR